MKYIKTINDMKYIKTINEMIENDDLFKIIKSYIEETLNFKEQINDYVPNRHIAETFKQYLIHYELETLYPDVYLNPPSNENSVCIEKYLRDLFSIEKLNRDSNVEIHRVYQKLRETTDEIRNIFKLANIFIPSEYSYGGRSYYNKRLKSEKLV